MEQYCKINGIPISEVDFDKSIGILSNDVNCDKDVIVFLKEWFSESDSINLKTSGSTGEPKEISLSKSLMINSAICSVDFFNLKKDDKAFLPLSVQYIAGKMMIVRSLIAHLDLHIINPISNPAPFIDQEYDFCVMVPMQFETIVSKNCLSKLSNIKSLLLGGGAIYSNIENVITKLDTKCYLSYGMTETASHVAIRQLNHCKQTNVFNAMPGTTFSTDDRGCLIISSSVLGISDLITNDIVEIVSPHSFIWKGRYDNVINSGGIKLFPETIEKKIEHLIDTSFYLTKRKDPILGEAVVMIIEGKEPDENKKNSIVSKLRKELSAYEVPKEIVFQPHLKRTKTGKIIRDSF